MLLDFFNLNDRYAKKIEKKLSRKFNVDFLVDCFSRKPPQIGVRWLNGPSVDRVNEFLQSRVSRADLKRQYSREFMYDVIEKLVAEGAPEDGFTVYVDDVATGACNLLFVGREGRCDDIIHWTQRVTDIMKESGK